MSELYIYQNAQCNDKKIPIISLDCDSWASFWFHVDDEQAFCSQLCSPVGNVMNYLLTNKQPKLDRIKQLKIEG